MTMQRAVVIGGSIAGLCAARVLADYFDRVTVLDRDSYPAGPLDRAGVPQGRHVHALLARGRRDLERLFPGFEQRMLAAGAHEIDFGCDFATLRGASWAVREESGIRTLFASRTLLETIVRDLLRALPRVELIERTAVTGLIAEREGRARVRAVRLADGELPAVLIVDATGRGSKAPDWLRTLGLEPPAETLVDSHSGYATRWYRAPDPARWSPEWWWKGIWVDPQEPEHMTAGVLFPVEGGRWIVTIAGIAGHYPPSDEAGFSAALGRLRSPIIAHAVQLAEPISPVYSNRAMANRFRHFERWPERLDGFLGDAWSLATGADFRFPGTTGARPALIGVFNRYLDALFNAAADDAALRRLVGEVIHMLRRPTALFAPSVLGRVARATLGRVLQPAAAE